MIPNRNKLAGSVKLQKSTNLDKAAPGNNSPLTDGRGAPVPGMADDPPPLRIIFLDIDGVICCNSMGRLEDKKMRILQAI